MALDPKAAAKQLSKIWADNTVAVLDSAGHKYALFSDIHLGNKSGADDFRKNEQALLRALKYYRDNGYDLLLLGDIEELWQFDLEAIQKKYNDTVYKEMRQFGDDHIQRIFGNHDIEWGSKQDPIRNQPLSAYAAVEALKMKTVDGKTKILMLHGHQGSIESDKNSWISKFGVRLYSYIEPALTKTGIISNPSMTKSEIAKDYERILYQWAMKNKIILICGHSHRAIFESLSYADRLYLKIEKLQGEIHALQHTNISEANKKLKKLEKLLAEWRYENENNRGIDPTENNRKPKPCYFNTGCALFKEGVTCIEIENDEIRLIKWYRNKKGAEEKKIYQQSKIGDCLQAIK